MMEKNTIKEKNKIALVFLVKTGFLILFVAKFLENFINMKRYKRQNRTGRTKALEKKEKKNKIILENKKPSSKMTFKAKSLLMTRRLPSSV